MGRARCVAVTVCRGSKRGLRYRVRSSRSHLRPLARVVLPVLL